MVTINHRVHDRDLLLFTIEHGVQPKVLHHHEKFQFETSPRGCLSIKNGNLLFYPFHCSENGFTQSITIRMNLVFRRTKTDGDIVFPIAKRVLHPVSVIVRPSLSSSPRWVGSLRKPGSLLSPVVGTLPVTSSCGCLSSALLPAAAVVHDPPSKALWTASKEDCSTFVPTAPFTALLWLSGLLA